MTDQEVVTTPLGERQGEKIGTALYPDALVGPHGLQRNPVLGFVPQPSLRAVRSLLMAALSKRNGQGG